MSADKHQVKLVIRDDPEHQWDQIVMAEVLIPDIPNAYGDINTRQTIREAMEAYMRQGYYIDVDHDNVDHTDDGAGKLGAFVVESFIARPGDPDFIEGSWVVGMKITDPALWQQILDGEINGYSFEAACIMFPVLFQNLRPRVVSGTTLPDPIDGHTHTFVVVLNALNQPIAGSTGVTNNHDHTITTHTITDDAANGLLGDIHNHRYQVIIPDEEDSDEQ